MVDQQPNPHQQRHYRALSKAVDGLVTETVAYLNDLSDAELDQAYKAINNLSTTNCGWTIYGARGLLKDLIDGVAKLQTRIEPGSSGNQGAMK